MVTVFELPSVFAGNDDTIYRTETKLLEGATSANSYHWTPSEGLSDSTILTPVAMPLKTTDYILTAIDGNGCIARDTVRIVVIVKNLLLVPNAFSPNQDGRNDLFRIIRHLNIKKLIEFKVFNRWGQLLWETTDINAGWDGTYKGEPQPVEVYQYYIKALNWDGEYIIKKDNLSLVR
jgi:gliding motility-associated-like protein